MPLERWGELLDSAVNDETRVAIVNKYYLRLLKGNEVGNCSASLEFYRGIAMLFWLRPVAAFKAVTVDHLTTIPEEERHDLYRRTVDAFLAGGIGNLMHELESMCVDSVILDPRASRENPIVIVDVKIRRGITR